MKITINQWFFRGLCLVLLGMFATNIGAQHYKNLSQEEKEQKSIALINEADAFVLATPISDKCFYGEDGKTIYTKIKIKVSHWYKGNGNRYIYMVLKGGVIGKDEQTYLHNPGPGIQFDVEYFMLLDRENENYRFTANIKASFGRYVNIYSDTPHIRAFYGLKFDSIEHLNEFVENLDEMKIPNKKKDVGSQEKSIEAAPSIDEEWLGTLSTYRAGAGEILTIKGENMLTDLVCLLLTS